MTWFALTLSDHYRVTGVVEQTATPTGDYVVISPYVGIPARPSSKYRQLTITGGALAWVDVRSLDAARCDKWEEIKAAREAAFNTPLSTPYGVFDNDKPGRDNIAQAAQVVVTRRSAAIAEATIDFTLADNSVISLSGGEMIDVGLRMAFKVQTAHDTARALRQQIFSASTVAEVDAFSWPA